MQVGDATDLQLLRHMLLEPEHTWGTDTKTWLDFDNYEPADLARMLDTKKYRVVEFSWIEKRQDQLDAIQTLPEAQREEAELAIRSLDPVWPVTSPTASKWRRDSRSRPGTSFWRSTREPARCRACATRPPGGSGRAPPTPLPCSPTRPSRRTIINATRQAT